MESQILAALAGAAILAALWFVVSLVKTKGVPAIEEDAVALAEKGASAAVAALLKLHAAKAQAITDIKAHADAAVADAEADKARIAATVAKVKAAVASAPTL